jgi:hypothetical protein
MRTIITFITTERPTERASSSKLVLMMDEEQLQDVNDEYVIALDDNSNDRWMSWKPDPYDADPSK